MRASIVPVGNSKGIRLPAAILKLCRIESEVEIRTKGRSIVISPVDSRPRAGWEESFKEMHARGDDRLIIDDSVSSVLEDWEW